MVTEAMRSTDTRLSQEGDAVESAATRNSVNEVAEAADIAAYKDRINAIVCGRPFAASYSPILGADDLFYKITDGVLIACILDCTPGTEGRIDKRRIHFDPPNVFAKIENMEYVLGVCRSVGIPLHRNNICAADLVQADTVKSNRSMVIGFLRHLLQFHTMCLIQCLKDTTRVSTREPGNNHYLKEFLNSMLQESGAFERMPYNDELAPHLSNGVVYQRVLHFMMERDGIGSIPVHSNCMESVIEMAIQYGVTLTTSALELRRGTNTLHELFIGSIIGAAVKHNASLSCPDGPITIVEAPLKEPLLGMRRRSTHRQCPLWCYWCCCCCSFL